MKKGLILTAGILFVAAVVSVVALRSSNNTETAFFKANVEALAR